MKTNLLITALAGITLAGSANAALLGGDTIGIDFQPSASQLATIPATVSVGTNFNVFDTDTDEDGVGVGANAGTDTLAQSATLAAGTLVRTSDGAAVSDVSFTLTNNTGQSTTRAIFTTQGAEGSQVIGSLLAEEAVWDDGYISNSQGGGFGLNSASHFLLTFSGLDDSLTYNLEGGFDNQAANGGNQNFDATWAADSQSFTTVPKGGSGYGTLTGLTTDGNGNLDITVHRNTNHVTISGLTLTAVPEPGSLALLGLGGLMMIKRRRRA